MALSLRHRQWAYLNTACFTAATFVMQRFEAPKTPITIIDLKTKNSMKCKAEQNSKAYIVLRFYSDVGGLEQALSHDRHRDQRF